MDIQTIWLTIGLIIINLCFIFIIKSLFLFRINVPKQTTAYNHYFSFIKTSSNTSRIMMVLLLMTVTLFNYAILSSSLFNTNNKNLGETLITINSPYNLKKTVKNIQQAIGNSNNRFIHKQYIDYGFTTTKNQSKKEVVIYFCNFGLLNKMMGEDKRIGIFLPFQVTAIERDGRVKIIALNPKQLGNKSLMYSKINNTLNKVYDAYVDILNEATI